VRVELPLIFLPAAFVRFRVTVDVLLCELAKHEHVARRALFDNRVAAMSDLALRFAREFPGVDQLHGRIPAECQTLLSTILVAVENSPRADVVERHPQRESWRRIVEIVDAPRPWRFQTPNRRVVENSTPFNPTAGLGERSGFGHGQPPKGSDLLPPCYP